MDETHKTCRIEHVDIIENYVKKTSERTRPYIPPSDTPTRVVKHIDLIQDHTLNRYLLEARVNDERIATLKKISLQLTLREIAGY